MSGSRSYRILKRLLDVVFGGVALILLSPILALVAALVAITMGRPVLFRQVRPGRGARPFEMLKFRTMSDARDASGQPLADAARLTAVGRWLRRTSLDELPELINVLKGEMSLVGPRPLLLEYLPLYTEVQARRHEVPPGITGWAQVNGRNALDWDDKLAFDTWYVEHCSLALDLKILLLTCAKVVKADGISQPGHATAPKFTGSRR
jgi:lipopolysaccharide/colanic/teichoic acid biosynthesis glycosyltransferase